MPLSEAVIHSCRSLLDLLDTLCDLFMQGIVMPIERISMSKLRELLRLKYAAKLPHRAIARSLSISAGAVSNLTRAAATKGLSWPLPETLDDAALEALVHGATPHREVTARKREPDYAAIQQALKRKEMTLQLLWEEYCAEAQGEACYGRSQFCQRYRDWLQHQPISMRQSHQPGEKLFIDYAGVTVPIVDPNTGEVHPAQVFVAVLGYSNYTYAEVTRTQRLADWLGAQQRALDFFGGVPKLLVPDNLKSAVLNACRYEPDLNPSYAHFARHYDVAVLPARPYKPKDKSKAEVGVQIVERWILARLRRHTFFSVSDANAMVRTLLTDLNQRRMRSYGQSRCERFEHAERAALSPLPAAPYVYTEIKKVRVHVDCHVEIDKHYYSVPHAYVRQELLAHCTAERITLWRQQRLLASHARSAVMGGHSTQAAHLPAAHRAQSQWSAQRLQDWAQNIGVACTQCVTQMLQSKEHPEQAYRACLGLLSLSRKYGVDRLEKACARALQLHSLRVKTVRNILENGLEQQPLTAPADTSLPAHDNLRGAHHYH